MRFSGQPSPTCTPVAVVVPLPHPPLAPTLQKLHILVRKSPPGHFGATPSLQAYVARTIPLVSFHRPSPSANKIPASSPLKGTPIK